MDGSATANGVKPVTAHEVINTTKARPVRQSAGQGTAKFFTHLLLLYLT